MTTHKFARRNQQKPDVAQTYRTPTRAQRMADHRKKMAMNARNRASGFKTELQQKVEQYRKDGSLKGALLNFARRRRPTEVRVSIWPEHKFAKPGRMA